MAFALSLAAAMLAQSRTGQPQQGNAERGNAVCRATAAEWQLLMQALLSSCSTASAQAWLGYVPNNLRKETQQLLSSLRSGCAPDWCVAPCLGQRCAGP